MMIRVNDNGIDRAATSDEIAYIERAQHEAQVAAADAQAAVEAQLAARESALSKLAALGLTDAEIAALVGR